MAMRFLKSWLPDDGPQRLVLLLFILMVFAIGWASWATVPQLARSSGQVIAQARTQVIQAANDGVVDAIPVHEGDSVKKVQLLMSLDASQLNAAVTDSRAKVAALRATLARLRAEVFERPLQFRNIDTTAYATFIGNQTDLYRRRKQALDEDLQSLQKMLEIAHEELNMNLPLLQSGDIAQSEVIHLRRGIADLDGKIASRRNKYFQDAQAEMTKAEEDLSTQQQVLVERVANLERMQIFAPTDGLVRNIRVTTLGSRVRPGDVVMNLLPTNSELIVEAKLRPQDLAFIEVGQAATVKLDAYDYSIYGVLDGSVIYISPDALAEETRAGEHIYYRVHVRIDEHKLREHRRRRTIDVRAGMTGQVEIKTGRITVLDYLAKPLIKTLSSSLSER